MSDTMRNLFPAEVRFVGGENPSDKKFNNWALMEKDALSLVSQAIGNIWHIDKTLQNRAEDPHPLLFTNLTRAIGNLELLNPAFMYNFTVNRYAQPLPAGQTEHLLHYWVNLPENYTAEDLLNAVYATGLNEEELDGAIVLDLANVKLIPEDLSQPGDWTVVGRTLYTYSSTNGKYFIYNAIWKLPDLAASFSVIPHLVQVINSGGVEVTKVTGTGETYYILQTPLYLYDYDGNAPHPSFANKRIPLPKICRYGANQLIPEGLITLWDLGNPPSYANATKVEGALFYGYGDEYHVVVKNVVLEEDNQRYVLVCAAEGLAYAVRQLRNQIMAFLEGNADVHDLHSRLRGLRFTGKDVHGVQISGWFPFPRSRVRGHDHTQYLHRMGFDEADANIWYNAMLGDLMMAASQKSLDGSWLNMTADSRKIIFGIPDGPSIYYNHEEGALEADDILLSKHDHSGGQLGRPVAGQYQVKVKSDDPVGGYLLDKIVTRGGITAEPITNPDGQMYLALATAQETGMVGISDDDKALGYLADKLRAGTGIKFEIETDDQGVQYLRISASGTTGTLRLQEFNESGTFTVPDGVTRLIVYLFGAGGGGGGGASADQYDFTYNSQGGGGGGSGEVKRVEIDVTPGQQIPVTIGAGGLGGGPGRHGNNGGLTSFGSFASVNGGRRGGTRFSCRFLGRITIDPDVQQHCTGKSDSIVYYPGFGGIGWNPSGSWGPGNGSPGEKRMDSTGGGTVSLVTRPAPGGSQGVDPIGRLYLYGASGGYGGKAFVYTESREIQYPVPDRSELQTETVYTTYYCPGTGGGGAGSYWSRGGNGGYVKWGPDPSRPWKNIYTILPGENAPGPGAGGGGGCGSARKDLAYEAYVSASAGGNGGKGKVVVTWYA